HWTKFANDGLVQYIAKAYAAGNNEEIAQIARVNELSDNRLEEIAKKAKQESIEEQAAQYDAKGIVSGIIKDFKSPTLDVSVQIQPVLFTPEFKEYMNKPESQAILSDFVMGTLV